LLKKEVERVIEQLSLMDSENDTELIFWGNYCNDDWSTKTKNTGQSADIVDGIQLKLTKAELKSICRRAVRVNAPIQYGYEVFFEDDGVKKEIFVRFINFTTRNRQSVFEHIDLYFDRCVE
jgi:cytochrome c biogenesis protein ResB